MNKKCTAIVYVIFLQTFLFSGDAFSQSLKFITLEVAPWAYTDKVSKEFVGIFPEIIKEIEDRTNYQVKITLTPYARIDRELETGRQDCTMLIKEPNRNQLVHLGELVFNHPMGVVPAKDISLSKYGDLYSLKISVLRALTITEEFSNDDKLKKEYDTDYQMGLRKIQHGRLDAIAGAIPTIQYLSKVHGVDHLLGEPLELSSEPIYLQCSKSSKKLEFMQKLNETIQSIKDDGTLDRILNKYS